MVTRKRRPRPDPYGVTICNICGGGLEHNSACPFGPDPAAVMAELGERPKPTGDPVWRHLLSDRDIEYIDRLDGAA